MKNVAYNTQQKVKLPEGDETSNFQQIKNHLKDGCALKRIKAKFR